MAAQLSLARIADLPAGALDEFERVFWPPYPNKKDKSDARKAFARARQRAPLAVIMAGLARYRFAGDPRFQRRASTWLNKSSWLDEEPNLTADRWGLCAWWERQAQQPEAMFSVRGYAIEALVDVLSAAGLEASWRGDLDTLAAWLCGGYRPDSVAEVVAEQCARLGGSPRRLAWLDKAVRARALRWHAVRGEWVRGTF